MARLHDRQFPGETAAYREAREALLAAEMDLRRQVEAVARQRRALPRGGRVPEDYVFTEGPAGEKAVRQVRFSELFATASDTLVLYSFMYPPDGSPCPMCTAFLDGLDGDARHAAKRVNLAVAAKTPIETLGAWAAKRGWRHLRLLSSDGTTYNRDYWAESPDGAQLPMLNVFRRTGEGIFHSWGSEMLYAPTEPGQNPRHVDAQWSLWNLLDLTPEGRGSDWYPAIDD